MIELTMMKNIFLLFVALIPASIMADTKTTTSIDGRILDLPKDFRQWRWIAPSYRTDKNSLRVIIANDIAWKAMQAGEKQFPEGSILGKIAWKEQQNPKFPAAIVPAELQQIDFMQKDQHFSATGGWGFSRWLGTELHRDEKTMDGQECVACHGLAQDNDYVFTQPAIMPKF